MPQDEPDINNFSTSSSHRLPTISGLQALHNVLNQAKGIPTNLGDLDLAMVSSNSINQSPGIQRGHITEIYGPPGSGKTTFAFQAVANTLRKTETNSHVVWVNTGFEPYWPRLDQILEAHIVTESQDEDIRSSPPRPPNLTQILDDHFTYLETQSLPHMLALLMHPTDDFPPPNTSLLIVDNLPNLIFASFPRAFLANTESTQTVQDKVEQQQSNRRYQIIERLGIALARLAATRRIAILVLSNATTSLRGTAQRAVLKSALGGQAWDPSIHTRIVLYRDFCPREHRRRLTRRERMGYRLAEVVRLSTRDVMRDPVPFVIEEHGLRALDIPTSQPEISQSEHDRNVEQHLPVTRNNNDDLLAEYNIEADIPPPSASQESSRPIKRKAFQIADSEEEDNNDNNNRGGTSSSPENGNLSSDEPQLPPIRYQPSPTAPDQVQNDGDAEDGEPDDMLMEIYEERFMQDY